MHVGTVAAGRIGLAVLRRLKPFDMHLHYYDRHRLPEAVEKELNLAWHPNVEDMVKVCDVVTINAPLHPETENLFNDKLLAKMKRGAYLVNTARGKICDRDAIVRALESGQLAGYAGDVWFPQPAPKDHPWRDHAAPWHDAAYLRNLAFGAGALRGRARARFSNAGSRAGRSATNISSSTAASSPAPARIPTAPGMRPADPRRRRNSRTPCDDAHEPATALSPRSPARQWDRPIRGLSATAMGGRVSLRARAVAARSIVYLGNVG